MHTLDPNHLPVMKGTLDRFLPNHHDELNGMLLRDGIEVHVPPHMGEALEALVRAGDTVLVRGVRLRGAPVIEVVSVETARGEVVRDDGPPKRSKRDRDRAHESAARRRAPCRVEGTVAIPLHGPHGEVRGCLLQGGTVLRWPPHLSDDLPEPVRAGAALTASGHALATRFGRVVDVARLRFVGGATGKGAARRKGKGDGGECMPQRAV